MSDRIDQPIALIVSGGRTGTTFFSEKLPALIPGSVGFHEPDTIHRANLIRDTAFVLREFGIYHGILGKLRNLTGPRNISHLSITGQIARLQLIDRFKSQRLGFYERQDAKLVIEANYGFYGILNVLPDILASYRVAAITRDPVTWIDSFLKRDTGHYGENDWINRLGLRITPADIGDHAWAKVWPQLKPADKLAWLWNLIYGYIEEAANNDPNIRVFRFEDLFLSSTREDRMRDLTTFIADAAGLHPITTLPDDLFGQRINASRLHAHELASDEARRAADAWCSHRRRRWYPTHHGPPDAPLEPV